jgi:TctA family transporter
MFDWLRNIVEFLVELFINKWLWFIIGGSFFFSMLGFIVLTFALSVPNYITLPVFASLFGAAVIYGAYRDRSSSDEKAEKEVRKSKQI